MNCQGCNTPGVVGRTLLAVLDGQFQGKTKYKYLCNRCMHKPPEETEMDMSKYAQSDSKDLKAADFLGKNLKAVISGVEIRTYSAEGDKPASTKPVLSFVGKEKGLVLNATNTKTLCRAYGDDSDTWLNREIGLSVQDYSDKGFPPGWVVTPLDIEPEDFDDDIPF